MAKQAVKMLSSMADHNFSYQYGEIVSVDKSIAKDWIKAGIAEPVKTEVRLGSDLKKRDTEIESLRSENKNLRKTVADLKQVNETLEAEKQAQMPLNVSPPPDDGGADDGADPEAETTA